MIKLLSRLACMAWGYIKVYSYQGSFRLRVCVFTAVKENHIQN